MALLRLIHALATGAATFGLQPTIAPLSVVPKTASEAFAEDALKLKGDFDRAAVKLGEEFESGGQSIAAKT